MVAIGAASLLAMLGYVGGPFPYGYRGLGEVFVLLFFGFIATGGSRLAYDGQCPAWVWWLGLPIGLLAAAILMANNLRDLPTDHRVGKRTLAVLLGEARARRLYFLTLWAAPAIAGLLAVSGIVPAGVGVAVATALVILPLHRIKLREEDRRSYLPLLGATARVHLVLGALVSLGLLF
jgi:1,4-dihydroxy-2-naphthoate octaprenyltransferase